MASTPAGCDISRLIAATLDAVPGVRVGQRGRPLRKPDKLHAETGYDHRGCQRECVSRSITLPLLKIRRPSLRIVYARQRLHLLTKARRV